MSNAKTLDQFFTNAENVDFCVKLIESICPKNTLWLEPSCGAGAFSLAFKSVFKSGVSADLEPQMSGAIQADFLAGKEYKATLYALLRAAATPLLTIGNPPFGSKGRLACQFINEAAEFSDVIAFILPISFRKYSTQSKVTDGLKLVMDLDLPSNIFLVDGKPSIVNCCFQIWVPHKTKIRKLKNLPDLRISSKPADNHPDFTIWQYNNTPSAQKFLEGDFDFAVCKQGYCDYSARKLRGEKLDPRKHWMFFKAKNNKSLKRLMKLDFESLSKASHTTTPGFSKHDVVTLYTSQYGDCLLERAKQETEL